MGTHPSRVQGKKKHKKTQSKEEEKQTINKNQLKTLHKEDWLWNDNQWQQKRPTTKELSFVTNWLMTKVH